MTSSKSWYRRTEKIITLWLADHSIPYLRIVLGIIFLWFGFLKFFPDVSAAEELATRTIEKITFDSIPDSVAVILLATWECFIGIGLIMGKFMRITLVLLFLQMIGTIMPLFFFPVDTFVRIPYAPSLEGQYIIKNFVIIGVAMILAATMRGGAVVADPEIAEHAKEEEEEKVEQLN